jgi:hypothetical protein
MIALALLDRDDGPRQGLGSPLARASSPTHPRVLSGGNFPGVVLIRGAPPRTVEDS